MRIIIVSFAINYGNGTFAVQNAVHPIEFAFEEFKLSAEYLKVILGRI